jgi:sugar (pentulose or hexulose) kinase
MQLYADIMNRPVSLLQTTECASWGAALLGAYAGGLMKEKPDVVARKLSKVGKQYQPRPEMVKAYDTRLEIYRQLYPLNKELIHKIAAL